MKKREVSLDKENFSLDKIKGGRNKSEKRLPYNILKALWSFFLSFFPSALITCRLIFSQAAFSSLFLATVWGEKNKIIKCEKKVKGKMFSFEWKARLVFHFHLSLSFCLFLSLIALLLSIKSTTRLKGGRRGKAINQRINFTSLRLDSRGEGRGRIVLVMGREFNVKENWQHKRTLRAKCGRVKGTKSHYRLLITLFSVSYLWVLSSWSLFSRGEILTRKVASINCRSNNKTIKENIYGVRVEAKFSRYPNVEFSPDVEH